MRRRTTAWLGLITLAALIAALLTATNFGGGGTGAGVGTPLFPEIRSQLGDIERINVSGVGGETTLLRVDGNWVVLERRNYPADATKVRRFLRSLGLTTRRELKTGDPEKLARVGLGDTATRVEASIADGKAIAVFQAGSSLPRGAEQSRWTFVRRGGEGRAWLVDALDVIETGPAGWLDKKVSEISAARFASAEVRPSAGGGYVLSGDVSTSEVTIEGLGEDEEMTAPELARATATALGSLRHEDVAPRSEISGMPLTQNIYRMADGLVVTATLSEDVEAKRWLMLDATFDADRAANPDGPTQMPDAPADGAGEAARLNARWGSWAYRLSATSVSDFLRPRSELVTAAIEQE